MSDVKKTMLLDGLDEAFDKKSWHGPNLRGAIRGVTAEQAAWRPGDDRHNIWELTLHATYWKYIVRRKILREKRGSFVLAGSNFFERPEGSAAVGVVAATAESEWKRNIAILEAQHRQLRDTVAELPARAFTPALCHLIRGAAAHDLYHAGQIRLLRRMCP
ncbi:MAG: DinB family protein [Acidobacteriota bacterium]